MSAKPNSWACIARMGGYGDNLIASSVLPGLKRRHGHVEVISSEPFSAMFENNPSIDKLTLLPSGYPQWGDGHQWQAWFRDRAREYAFFANLSHSCEATGVLLKVQTQFWWRDEMRRKLCGRSYLEIAHDICGVPYDEIAPGFFPTDEETAQADETVRKVGGAFIGWTMSGSRIDKVHPEADVAVARLIRETGLPVVLFGGPGRDFEFAKTIEEEARRANKSTEGLHLALSPDPANPSWPPRRICTMIQRASVVVGPDTGPMWAVAMSAMPKVMLASHAGPTNVTKHWKRTVTLHADQKRVPCFPCHRLHDDPSTCTPNANRSGAACISDISVDEIVSNVTRLLKEEQANGGDQRVHGKGDARLGSGRSIADPADDASGGAIARIAHLHERF